MKLSDYVVRRIEDHGVQHVFMLTGGGAMHLNDSFGHAERIRPVFQHHEQACAMAAEGYARITGKAGVVQVTTGPGGINALNGVFSAWTDSIPMLVISGQVKRETCMASYPNVKLRQLGDQEADTRRLAGPITKYFGYVDDPRTIRYHLDRALFLAEYGRPGPCWIDIPVDVQSAAVSPDSLTVYDPVEDTIPEDTKTLSAAAAEVQLLIQGAERPVLMVGKGIRSAGAMDILDEVMNRLKIPVVTAWTGIDTVPTDHPLFCGRPGDVGDRPGNFTVQNADLLIMIGTRMGLRQVSYNWTSFARYAFKIHVEIDPEESLKPIFRADRTIRADASSFLRELNRQLEKGESDPGRHAPWLAWCRARRELYPVVLPRHREVHNGLINPYHFLECLFRQLGPADTVACGNGAANVMTFQTAGIPRGMRVFCNTGNASMGYDLPAAIGAAFAREGARVICLAGDGSIQLNIQELQTVRHYALPIKIFILNNGGYLSIRGSQRMFFGRLTGESLASGLSFPDIVRVASAYGIPARRISGRGFETGIRESLDGDGPCLCEVMLDPDQLVEPRVAARPLPDGRIVSAPMEDMYPFLSREELEGNLLIPAMED